MGSINQVTFDRDSIANQEVVAQNTLQESKQKLESTWFHLNFWFLNFINRIAT